MCVYVYIHTYVYIHVYTPVKVVARRISPLEDGAERCIESLFPIPNNNLKSKIPIPDSDPDSDPDPDTSLSSLYRISLPDSE